VGKTVVSIARSLLFIASLDARWPMTMYRVLAVLGGSGGALAETETGLRDRTSDIHTGHRAQGRRKGLLKESGATASALLLLPAVRSASRAELDVGRAMTRTRIRDI